VHRGGTVTDGGLRVLGGGLLGLYVTGWADLKETGSTAKSTDKASTRGLTGIALKGPTATARGTDEA
jgi:hypothetical protein